MEYRGYWASIDFDSENRIFLGSVYKDYKPFRLLNFHGTCVDELEKTFHQKVDNYLGVCTKDDMKPKEKKVKGMDKGKFVEAMTNICKTREFEYELRKLSYKYNGSLIFGIQSTCIDSLIAALAVIFEDKGRWINYYVFELDCGKKYRDGMTIDKNGNNIDLSTPEKLYEFLIDNKESDI